MVDIKDTFEIKLTRQTAWLLAEKVLPGPNFLTHGFGDQDVYKQLVNLRLKINAAILRFEDENGLRDVDITISTEEGWLIDQVVKNDGPDGLGHKLLVQVYRGLWGLDYQLPTILSPEKDDQCGYVSPDSGYTSLTNS